MDFAWMGWTTPTAVFFGTIAGLILAMFIWELLVPGGGPRKGILGLHTTRGDRLFISLLSSAGLCLAWLGLVPLPLWWALAACVALAALIFWLC